MLPKKIIIIIIIIVHRTYIAQSTLEGQDIFARKNMHEKLTKCPNFT